jgi:hypothetical protein
VIKEGGGVEREQKVVVEGGVKLLSALDQLAREIRRERGGVCISLRAIGDEGAQRPGPARFVVGVDDPGCGSEHLGTIAVKSVDRRVRRI